MNERTDFRSPAAALVLAMVLLALWCFWTLTTSRSRATTAAIHFTKCEQLATKIKRLRKTSDDKTADNSVGQSATDLGEFLGRAGPTIGVVRIDPQPTRRIQNSDWVEETASVTLQPITMQELAMLLSAMSEVDSNLRAPFVRMTRAKDELPGLEERWDVEMTLTHSMFSPKNVQKGSSS